MKTTLTLSILFCAIALPGIAELTDADLDKIRLIVKEEIQEELKPIKADIASVKADIASVKTDIGTLKTDITVLKTEVPSLKETVNTNFDTTQKNFDRQNNIIIVCIGIPMGILAIGATVWGILAQRRNRTNRIQSGNAMAEFVLEQMADLPDGDRTVIEALIRNQDQKIESLTQEIETLKQQRTVNP